MARQIFFDVTDLRTHLEQGQRISGIQRVCLMVIDHILAQAPADRRLWLSFLDRSSGNYLAVAPKQTPGYSLGDPRHFAEALGVAISPDTGGSSLAKYRPGSAKYLFHATMRRANALIGNEAHFRKRGLSIADWQRQQGPKPVIGKIASRKVPEIAVHGDTVALLGAFWGNEAQATALTALKAQGLEVALLIHDLIPLTMPEAVAGHHGLTFYDALLRSGTYTTRYITNSAYTRTDLQAFLTGYGLNQPVHVVPLAQDGISPPEIAAQTLSLAKEVNAALYPKLVATASVSPQIKALSKYPYVLCVGTWDTRKNLWRLAQAWQRLSTDPTIELPKLVLAGGPGWGTEDFMGIMKSSGNLGGWVELVSHPSDHELAFLYENCLFTAMVSLYEGWGLPIGEGLAFGKTGVVANNSSMPEVGGDLVEYCEATSITSIHDACCRLISDPAHREALEAKIAATKLRTWDDVARDVLSEI